MLSGSEEKTLVHPDSLFFYGDNNNPGLSIIDKKALELLFGQGVENGMSANDSKKGILF
jgi:hypothetical protein